MNPGAGLSFVLISVFGRQHDRRRSILNLKACFSANRSMRYDRTAEAKSLAGEIAICLTFNGIMLDA